MRFWKSLSLRLATGYIVLSGKVMALRKVFKEPLTSSTNGSLSGYFLDPQSTECSTMCATPVSSAGVVRKLMENTLLSSSFSKKKRRAPLFSCTNA